METTPSQTIGPFFHLCLTTSADLGRLAGPDAKGERIKLVCSVMDGDGAPVADAMLEIWQADAAGKYLDGDPGLRGFGRQSTNEHGVCAFETVKPGCVPPHVNVMIFARGLLKHLFTRIYFAGDPAHSSDPILALVPEDRRGTLLAHAAAGDPHIWNFKILLAGECETVFFDI